VNPDEQAFANFLLSKNFITDRQFQEVLNLVRSEAIPLFKALKKLRLPGVEELKKGIESGYYTDVKEIGDIPENVLKTVPRTVARNQVLIPWKIENNRLTIVCVDPLTVFAIADLELLTGHKIEIALARESEVNKSIFKYYV
jgi:type IV pilus assembly protein PilB